MSLSEMSIPFLTQMNWVFDLENRDMLLDRSRPSNITIYILLCVPRCWVAVFRLVLKLADASTLGEQTAQNLCALNLTITREFIP
jgi:hypothetical protein